LLIRAPSHLLCGAHTLVTELVSAPFEQLPKLNATDLAALARKKRLGGEKATRLMIESRGLLFFYFDYSFWAFPANILC